MKKLGLIVLMLIVLSSGLHLLSVKADAALPSTAIEVLFNDFETAILPEFNDATSSTNDQIILSGTQKHGGAQSLYIRAEGDGANTGQSVVSNGTIWSSVIYDEYWHTCWVYINNFNDTTMNPVLQLQHNSIYIDDINEDGTLDFRTSFNTTKINIQKNCWTLFEVNTFRDAAVGYVRYYYNGTLFEENTGLDTSLYDPSPSINIYSDAVATHGNDAYIDDFGIYIVPNEATIVTPTASAIYPKGSPINVAWTLPGAETQSGYQIQIGNAGFTVIYSDTGVVSSSTPSGIINAPNYAGTCAIRVYYYNDLNGKSRSSDSVSLTITGSGDGSTPIPTDTDGDGIPDATDPYPTDPLNGQTEPPTQPPEIPAWVPEPITDVIIRLTPWWQKYGAAVIIGCVVAAFVLYSTKPKKRKRGGLDAVLNPEKFFQ